MEASGFHDSVPRVQDGRTAPGVVFLQIHILSEVTRSLHTVALKQSDFHLALASRPNFLAKKADSLAMCPAAVSGDVAPHSAHAKLRRLSTEP